MTRDEISALFEYEHSTGLLRRKEGTGGRKEYPWRPAGSNKRYLCTSVGGELLYAHHAVWILFNGYKPERLDHINGNGWDNRIENLRECTSAQNQYNSRMKRNNRTGYKGVVMHKACKHKKYQAKIVVEGKVLSLGYYATAEEAAEAYMNGAIKVAGAFARV